jgi:hypothetical protein
MLILGEEIVPPGCAEAIARSFFDLVCWEIQREEKIQKGWGESSCLFISETSFHTTVESTFVTISPKITALLQYSY